MNNEIGISPRQIAKAIDDLLDDRNDLQQRIDKATELLSNWNYDDSEFEVDRKNINKLLSILKGKEMINNE